MLHLRFDIKSNFLKLNNGFFSVLPSTCFASRAHNMSAYPHLLVLGCLFRDGFFPLALELIFRYLAPITWLLALGNEAIWRCLLMSRVMALPFFKQWQTRQRPKKGKLGADAMKRVAEGAHLPTPWLFETAKRPDDRADYCLDCSFLPQWNN